jgi:protein-S-isoprenylcysteine O-methyltransferase Ste14
VKLALKIPPVVQALIFGFLMWILDKRMPIGQFDFTHRLPAAMLFAVAAIGLVVSSMLAFRRVSTTVDPFHPEEASHLVVDGVFGVSRNPMYVSLALLLIGWSIFLGNVYNLVLVLAFIAYLTQFQIKPEEKTLKSLFGERYEQYCSHVRRWI